MQMHRNYSIKIPCSIWQNMQPDIIDLDQFLVMRANEQKKRHILFKMFMTEARTERTSAKNRCFTPKLCADCKLRCRCCSLEMKWCMCKFCTSNCAFVIQLKHSLVDVISLSWDLIMPAFTFSQTINLLCDTSFQLHGRRSFRNYCSRIPWKWWHTHTHSLTPTQCA